MSLDALNTMLAKGAEDAELRAALEGEHSLDELVAIGRLNGFEVTPADFTALQTTELGDDALDGVVGGLATICFNTHGRLSTYKCIFHI